VYDHYNIKIQREFKTDKSPDSITYLFICKTHPTSHKTVYCPREKREGTSNLNKTLNACLEAQGLERTRNKKSTTTSLPYSAENHRAIIAMRSAVHGRSFNEFQDKYYKMEVEMLRPGTVLPHPSTVSRDLNEIYLKLSNHVKNYFAVCSLIHIIWLFSLKIIESSKYHPSCT
jgi:hypothetical protein